MTNITSTARTKSYTGNGTAGPFDFSFQINSFTEVKVFVDDTLKTAGVHYNVENSNSESSKLNADGTGRIRFTAFNFPTSSQTITIVSNVPLSRTSVYSTGGPITASSLETDFNTSLMHHQQISTRIDRTIGVPEGEPDTVSMTLPAVSQRANHFLKFDANGNVTTTLTPSDLGIGASIIFEGATDNEYETTVTVTDPTADRTWTIPDVTDTFVGTTATQSLSNKTLTNTAITSFSSSASLTGGVGIGIDAHGHSVGVSIGKNAGRTQGLDSFAGTPYKDPFGSPWDTDGTISIGFSATEDIRGKGKYNVAIGYEALQYIGANQPFFTNFDNGAGDNIAIGRFALKNTDFTGYGNVALGAGSGSTITTGDGNTMLGFNTEPSSATATAEFKIGAYNTDILDKVTYMSGTASGTVGTVLVNNHLTVGGNLTVNGDTLTVNTATLSVEDPLIILAKANNSSDSLDIGFYGLYDTSGSQDLYAGLFRDANDSGKWKLFKDLQSEPTTTVDTSGTGYTVGTLVANVEGNVTGDVTGNVSGTAGIATSITASANNSTDETVFPTFVDGATGTQGLETDTGLTYNPSTGVLTATQFTGALSGNATSATTATTATNANHVSVADNENTDENNLIPFIEDGSATGNVGLESDGDLTYNPSTGRLSATQLAGTLQTASQPNVTGVGTISTGVWNATAIADAYISSSATWNAKVDTGGTGLTKVGTTLNVDSSQPGITSLGTLTSLTVDGDATLTGANYNVVWDKSANYLRFNDNARASFGTSDGLTIHHNQFGNSFIVANTGHLYITNGADNQDVQITTDDGSGGLATYFLADGSSGEAKLFHYGTQKLSTKSTGVEIDGGVLDIKNDGSQSELRLYCESNNAHYASIKAPAHADFSGNITLTLPATTGTLLSTANSDAPTTTTSSSDADFVLVDDGGVMKKITPANLGIGSGTSGITVQDEGNSLSTAGTTLNFVGAGVTASGTGAVKTITISGGSGSGSGSGGAFTDQTWGASLDSDSSTKSKLFFKNDYRNIVIGTSNTVAEPSASLDQTGSAYDNIFIGHDAGYGATTAIRNILVGRQTGHTLTSGDDNTFIGYHAGYNVNADHDGSVIVGMSAGAYMPNAGNERTVAVGYSAGARARAQSVSIGSYAGTNFGYYGSGAGAYQCVHIGGSAGYNYYNYYRDYNVTVGWGSGRTARSGDHNVMDGYNADGLVNSTSYAVAVGSNAKVASNSVSIGYQSQNSGSSASINMVSIGYQAGFDTDGGDNSVFIGYRAGYAGGTGNSNIGIGYEPLFEITSGNSNIAMGYQSLYKTADGGANIGIGYQAGYNVTTADFSIFIGYEAGKQVNGNAVTADHNIGIGYRSQYRITGGERNVTLGSYSGDNLSDGNNNVCIGYQAGNTLTTGNNNVIIGYGADAIQATKEKAVAIGGGCDAVSQGTAVGYLAQSSAHTGAFGSTSIGYYAGYDVRNDYNTFVGWEAGKGASGDENVGIGKSAIDGMSSSADYNTAVGSNCMNVSSNVSGSSNSALGYYAGSLITSGSNNTAVGEYAMGRTYTVTGDNNTCIGHDAKPTSTTVSNEITLGDSNIATLRCQVTSITALSDQRDKTAIEDLDLGLKFVNAMKPRKFTWNRRDGKWVGKKEIGFIAQELHELEMDFSSTERTRLVNYENPSRLEAQPMNTYPILVKAIQELSAKVDSLQAEITKLKGA